MAIKDLVIQSIVIVEFYSICIIYSLGIFSLFFFFTEPEYNTQISACVMLCLVLIEVTYFGKNHIIGDKCNTMYYFNIFLYLFVNISETGTACVIVNLDPINIWYCYYIIIKCFLFTIIPLITMTVLCLDKEGVENYRYYSEIIYGIKDRNTLYPTYRLG